MKRLMSYLLPAAMLPVLTLCQNKYLYMCEEVEVASVPVRVLFHFDTAATGRIPSKMRLMLYPETGGSPLIYDLPNAMTGNLIWLPQKRTYHHISYDYEGTDVAESDRNSRTGFRVFCRAVNSANLQPAEALITQPIVMEPDTAAFYASVDTLGFWTDTITADTLVMHVYPRNVLHEFTFLIHGVEGAKNIIATRGNLTGMAGEYFLGTGEVRTPSAVRFMRRIKAYVNGQAHQWSDEQKRLFAAKCPNWDDTISGWTGDWLTGAVCAFAPIDLNNVGSLLMVTLSNGGEIAAGVWDSAATDNEVVYQIRRALGYNGEGEEGGGTWEEQRQWRERNCGYDIILDNRGKLKVPAGSGGLFDVDANEWDRVIIPLKPSR